MRKNINKKIKKRIVVSALTLLLAFGSSFSAYAIGPGEGMGSQGGTTSAGTDSDPWSGYTNEDGSAFSYLERGVSISKFQNQKGSINWNQVKNDGIDFAIVRISYGLTEDAYFDQNVTGAQAAGIKVGAYVCATAKTMEETIAEANLAVSKISKYSLPYPVAYDMEVSSMLSGGATPAELTAMANKFCEIVAAAGYTPVVYANANWLKNYLNASDLGYDVWYAAYPEDKVYRPVSGTNTTIWQTGDSGIVAGITGNVTTEFSKKAYGGGSPSTKYAVNVGSSSSVIYAGGTGSSAGGPGTTTAVTASTGSGQQDTGSSTGNSSAGTSSTTGAAGTITGWQQQSSTGTANSTAAGWQQQTNGSWQYLESGKAATGWKQIGGYWYYFYSDGTMAIGWVEDQGKWYYMGLENGDMKTGWRFVNEKWYYMEESGVMVSSATKTIGGKDYQFDESGACQNPY